MITVIKISTVSSIKQKEGTIVRLKKRSLYAIFYLILFYYNAYVNSSALLSNSRYNIMAIIMSNNEIIIKGNNKINNNK